MESGLPSDLEGIIWCFLYDPIQTLVVQELDSIKGYIDFSFGSYSNNNFAACFFSNRYHIEECSRYHREGQLSWLDARRKFRMLEYMPDDTDIYPEGWAGLNLGFWTVGLGYM
jgi:hypothetical protein